MENKYYIQEDYIIAIINKNENIYNVKMPVYTLIISLYEGHFKLKLDDGNETPSTFSFLLPDCNYSIILEPTHTIKGLVVYFDCFSKYARFLKSNLEGRNHFIGQTNFIPILEITQQLEDKKIEHLAFINRLFDILFSSDILNYQFSIDERIVNAVHYIKKNYHLPITNKDLEQITHLSKSRFTHLFMDELQVGCKRYILLLRMKKIAALYLKGKKLTHISSSVSWFNSGHFTSKFKSFLSRTPKDILK